MHSLMGRVWELLFVCSVVEPVTSMFDMFRVNCYLINSCESVLSARL